MAGTLALYWYLVRLQIRTRLEYRANLVIAWFAQAFGYASVYGSIWLIANRFQMIGGWSWPEIALLLGFHVLGYSLGAMFTFVQLRNMEERVRTGTFDVLLVQPINPWAFLAFSGFNIEYGGHVLLGIGLIVWAAPNAGMDWTVLSILQLGFGLISAALLTASILTMISAMAMILTRSRYLFGFYFDFWEMARYPLTIFAWPVQIVMLTIMPLGFMAYVPVAALLGKPVPFLGSHGGLASLLAGPFAVVIASFFWRFCLRRYQGAGG